MNKSTETDQDLAKKNGFSFLERVVNLILYKKKIVGHPNWILENNEKVIQFKHPKELKEILNLEIRERKQSEDELFQTCEKVIEYEPLTSHPRFYNQLYAGVDQFSLAGSWLTDSLNTSMATYETSPVFTLVEIELIKFFGSILGFDTDSFDGVAAPGGSMSNIYAMLSAKNYKYPETKEKGLKCLKQLVLFASDNSHYSYSKGAMVLGLGTEAVIKIKTDDYGRMIPEELEKEINKAINDNQLPFMVGCTAGTTVFCAFDPLKKIREICVKYKIWMHVDACLGGNVAFSSLHKGLLEGIEDAESLSWNLHKMSGAPLQSSFFLVKKKNYFKNAFDLQAEYLFQSDKYYDANYDLGDKSIQCGRKVDAFKIFIMLAAKGKNELERLVNKVFEVRNYLIEIIKKRKDFKLVIDKFQGNTVCFWYLPPCFSEIGWENIKNDDLHKVCPKIKGEMMKRGSLMVNYQPMTCKNFPNFFRMVLTCVPEPTNAEMDFLLDEIEAVGKALTLKDFA